MQMRMVPLVAMASAGLALAGGGGASPGNPVAGKEVWLQQNSRPWRCAGCHTLRAANAYGTTGPNLDKVKPSVATAIKFITNGSVPSARWPVSMQTFGGVLTKQQIRDLAAFIYSATH
jgi:mono/diheme cytochrome c family protein